MAIFVHYERFGIKMHIYFVVGFNVFLLLFYPIRNKNYNETLNTSIINNINLIIIMVLEWVILYLWKPVLV